MAKGYEELSRRGLIQLGKDFDQDNDAALIDYLTKNSDKYESIRPVESVIDKIDKVAETFGGSKINIKNVVTKEADKLLDAVVDAISGTADVASNELINMKGMIDNG